MSSDRRRTAADRRQAERVPAVFAVKKLVGPNMQLCQATADACNRPVLAGPVEATAIGNLLMQAVAIGDILGVKSPAVEDEAR